MKVINVVERAVERNKKLSLKVNVGDEHRVMRSGLRGSLWIRRRFKGFRALTTGAYIHSSTLFRLKHSDLLNAAQMIANKRKGEPVVSNGLSLCKIHHAAFGNNILGISSDYIAMIRDDILHEKDCPMLKHGYRR